MYGEDNSGQFVGVSSPPSQSVKTDWFRDYVDAREQPVDDQEEEGSNENSKSNK